jgi:hypothetical protein
MRLGCRCTALACLYVISSVLSFGQTSPRAASVDGKLEGLGANATVRLERAPSDPLAEVNGFYGSVGKDGHFHFTEVPPGQYRLIATADNLLRGEYGSSAAGEPGSPLTLHAGDQLHDLTIPLSPDPPVLCGRVLDAAGHPVLTSVEAYGIGSPLRLEQPTQLTAADGSFRFPHLFYQGMFFLRANGVWYPGSTSFAQARPLAPSRADQGACVTIQFPPVTRCEGHKLTGKLTASPVQPVFEYEVSLLEVNPSGNLFPVQMMNLNRADGIDFNDVCDGKYIVSIRNEWSHTPQHFTSSIFSMNGSGKVVDVRETTEKEWQEFRDNLGHDAPSASVDLHIKLQGLDAAQACSVGVVQQVNLQREGDRNPVGAVANNHEHLYQFKSLPPGLYSLSPGMYTHGNAYLRSVSLDGERVDSREIPIVAGPHAVEVVVSNDPKGLGQPGVRELTPQHYLPVGMYQAATLDGMLTGNVPPGTTVILRALRFNSARSMEYKVSPETTGHFRFEAIDPGIYTLVAQTANQPDSAFGSRGPGLAGTPVMLHAGDRRQGVRLPMLVPPVICGRLLDVWGTAVVGTTVQLTDFTNTNSGGQRPPMSMLTDAKGRFHFVATSALENLAITENASSPYSRTHPLIPYNERNSDASLPQSGTCPYDIEVSTQASGAEHIGHTVSGTVRGAENLTQPEHASRFGDTEYDGREHLTVQMRRSSTLWSPYVWTAPVEKDRFILPAAPSGHYALELLDGRGDAMMACSAVCYGETVDKRGAVSIDVAQDNVTDLTLERLPAANVVGTLLIDGKPPQESKQVSGRVNWSSWIPELVKPNTSERPISARVDGGGHFTMEVSGGVQYHLLMNNFWPDFYVKSITVAGAESADSAVQLTPGQTVPIVINIATDSASGTVQAIASMPPVDSYRDLCHYFGGSGMLTLLLHDRGKLGGIGYLTGYVRSDHAASFNGVAPGNYRAVATEAFALQSFMRSNPLLNNQRFLARLWSLGKPVELASGRKFNVDVPDLTAEVQSILVSISGKP